MVLREDFHNIVVWRIVPNCFKYEINSDIRRRFTGFHRFMVHRSWVWCTVLKCNARRILPTVLGCAALSAARGFAFG